MALPRSAPARPAAAARGPALLLLSAVAFSTAGFFTREAPAGLWATIAWRNGLGVAALAAALPLLPGRARGRWRPAGVREWGMVASASLGTVFYIAALANTAVADVSILYATGPMMAAALAWATLGERMAPRTLAAAALALVGVAVTVGGALGSGTLLGDAMALAMTASLSVMAVLARGSTLPALPASLVSALLTAAAAVALGLIGGSALAVDARTAAWLGAFGLATIGVAMPCYFAGAAAVEAGRALLISALEMPLAPLWVWLAFGEAPSATSAVGGGIVLVAVLLDVGTAPADR